MDLDPYLSDLQRQLAAAADAGGPEAHDLAERLTAPLESAMRLALLEALAAAAAEITAELAPGSVELRLRGRDPEFVVVVPPTPDVDDRHVDHETPPTWDDDSPMTRINLRLGQDLKDRVEAAARRGGTSVNAWLVRAAGAALARESSAPPPRSSRGADRFRGWVH